MLILIKLETPGLQQDNILHIQNQAKEFALKFNLQPIAQKAYQRWQESEPEWASYHKIGHTDDVLQEALFFAIADGITDERSLRLIGIMATYHDVGLTMEPSNPDNLRQDHEARGAVFVREVMIQDGSYTEEEITIVVESIEDTKILYVDGVLIQQKARHELGKYLLDGDVANFGRDDFSQKSELEFAELQLVLKNPPNRADFNKTTLGLIKNHKWQTAPAIKYRTKPQEDNIDILEKAA